MKLFALFTASAFALDQIYKGFPLDDNIAHVTSTFELGNADLAEILSRVGVDMTSSSGYTFQVSNNTGTGYVWTPYVSEGCLKTT